MNIEYSQEWGYWEGGREVLIELLRSWQLSRKKREGGFTGLAHNSCQSTDHNGNYISDVSHKFQNKTALDAKANSDLYKSKRVNSVGVTEMKVFTYITVKLSDSNCLRLLPCHLRYVTDTD
jgi:hypothetical protein